MARITDSHDCTLSGTVLIMACVVVTTLLSTCALRDVLTERLLVERSKSDNRWTFNARSGRCPSFSSVLLRRPLAIACGDAESKSREALVEADRYSSHPGGISRDSAAQFLENTG
jgi:hypothetical protein